MAAALARPSDDAPAASAQQQDASPPTDGGRRTLVLAAIFALVTFLAYAPSLPGEFIWDDDDYVTENVYLRDSAGLAALWKPGNTPQYYPVTFSSFWLEYRLWGLNPLGYHVVNLLLHVATGLLLWRLMRRLGIPVAAFVAAAFLLHPQHVETVAWVMERKNTLSALFYVLAANAYLTYELRAERSEPRSRAYLAALAFFALALLSKTIVCTLPAALVLMRLYRRRPLTRAALVPLLPFLVLGLALATHTASIEHGDLGASGADFAFTPAERLLIASRATLFYASKLLVPYPLLFQYPRWTIDAGDPLAWWAPLTVLLIAGLLLLLWRRGQRGPFLAGALFVGSLAPALGFVSFYPMKFSFVADHFNYLPSFAFLLLVAGAIHCVVTQRLGSRAQRALAPVAAAALLALGAGTAVRSHHFRSAESIYRHTLAHHPGAFLASGTLAKLVLDRAQAQLAAGDTGAARATLAEAEQLYASSLRQLPDDYDLLFSHGLTLHLLERPEAALPDVERATEVKPRRQDAWRLRGVLLQRLERYGEAETTLRKALSLPSRDEGSYRFTVATLAECQAKLGRLAEALATIEAAIETLPSDARDQAGASLRAHIRSIEPVPR